MLLKLGMQTNYIYHASHHNTVINAACAAFILGMLCSSTCPTQPTATILFFPLFLIERLPMCMMESALTELNCNIHREREIISNSISGFQRGGSFKRCAALLRSRWSTRIRKEQERDDQSPAQSTTTGLPQEAQQKLILSSLSLSLSLSNQQKHKPAAASWAQKDKKRTGGDAERTGSRVRGTRVTSLPALRSLKHGKQQKMRRRDTP